MPVSGRKIVVFSAPGHNTLPVIAGNARSAAGHFDHYVCFNYQRNVNNGHDHVPRVLADTLRECGVADEWIDIQELELDAFESIFRLGAPRRFRGFPVRGWQPRGDMGAHQGGDASRTAVARSALQHPIFTSSLQCSRAIVSGSRSARASSSSDPSTPVTTSGSGSSPAR